MKEKTKKDLKRFKEIEQIRSNLYSEKCQIKLDCPCLDSVAVIEETFSFEITPKSVCPVCNKDNGDLSLEEKKDCLRKHFTYDDSIPLSEKWLTKIAKAGGCNLDDPCFYIKDTKDATDKET